MNWMSDWLSAAANAIAVGTALFGAVVFGRAQVRRYMEKRRQRREMERQVAADYARLFPDDKPNT